MVHLYDKYLKFHTPKSSVELAILLNFTANPEIMAKTKAESGIAGERLALYDDLIADLKGIERKGATMPYTSVNGHMFSFLAKDGSLALRLPAEEREAFLTRHKAVLCEAHGTVLKEYVAVPEKLLKKKEEMKAYFKMSLGYVKGLKPKPAAKKK